MALHFILLPNDYLHKTLKVEINSPYALYSGRTHPILLGTIPSLEAHSLSRSMRSFILMAMCLALGISLIAFTFVQGFNGVVRKELLAIGVFAVIWALYYVCTEYIVFQFFTPLQMSVLSLGLYFSFQAPLTLFFYFSFERYKKQMLPAVILHSGFAAAALALQLFGIMDLPRLININNVFLAGFVYTIILTVLEAAKKNRMMILAAPFLIIAYGSMLHNFYVFYTRDGVVPYTYRDTYLLLVSAVLVFDMRQFFGEIYRHRRENELLSLQKRLAQDSYQHIKAHLHEVGGLKHETRNHFAAMRTYLEGGRLEEALSYLNQYSKQVIAVTETVYHDNFLINSVVGDLLQRARERDIKVDLNLKAAPARIADPDLYSLLSNIADNALEACMTMPDDRERFIRLTVARREPYLNIRCVNSKSGEIIIADGKIQTTKTGSGHGYGLWTIGRIVDAYDGIMNIDHDENTFTVIAALKDQKIPL
jgi:signal transduction histidine kinase